MDRLFQRAWDRHGAVYSWVLCAICYLVPFPIYLVVSFAIVALERSDHYLAGACATAVAMLVLACGLVLPGIGPLRLVERWAAGDGVDAATALEATYTWARGAIARGLAVIAVCAVVLSVVVGVIAGASGPRLVQFAVLGLAVGVGSHLIGVHSVPESQMRPLRATLAGATGIGDSLPRSRPTFAAWSSLSILAVAFVFSVAGVMVAAVFDMEYRLRPCGW